MVPLLFVKTVPMALLGAAASGLMGGVATASTLLGPAGFLEIMRAANKSASAAGPGQH